MSTKSKVLKALLKWGFISNDFKKDIETELDKRLRKKKVKAENKVLDTLSCFEEVDSFISKLENEKQTYSTKEISDFIKSIEEKI